jgi:hypothetical protein
MKSVSSARRASWPHAWHRETADVLVAKSGARARLVPVALTASWVMWLRRKRLQSWTSLA